MALPLTERLDSPRIMLLRPGIYDPQKFVIQEAIKTSTMFFDVRNIEKVKNCVC